MDVCNQCGHQLDIGRFCTNCGHPVGATPAVPVTSPPSLPRTGSGRHLDPNRRRGSAAGWVPWVAVLSVMLLVGGIGLWLLLDDQEPTTTAVRGDRPTDTRPDRDRRTPQGRATLSATPVSKPTDLARFTLVQAPPAAPPNPDLDGNQVRYDATNMVDGVPETCWRMPGDGTGETIVFRLEGPTELYEVGLVNGYAKVATDEQGVLDWYAGNRRISSVEWTLGDGPSVTQRLGDSREMQEVTLEEPVVTRQVSLRLLEVTPPGPGRASRDYTAISDVRLLGVPV